MRELEFRVSGVVRIPRFLKCSIVIRADDGPDIGHSGFGLMAIFCSFDLKLPECLQEPTSSPAGVSAIDRSPNDRSQRAKNSSSCLSETAIFA